LSILAAVTAVVQRQPGRLVVLQLRIGWQNKDMRGLCMLLCLVWGYGYVASLMVMDESSCVEVEVEECGFCHTIYMEECRMRMVEEMIPVKVNVCRNVSR
jgi:hypothetical protein